MDRFYNGFTVVNNTLKKAEMFLGSVCLAVLFVVMIVNAALRYLFSSGLNFSDELNGFLFVWLGFLSAAYIMANKGHLRVTAFVEILPPVVQYAISLLLNVVMLYMVAIYVGPLDKLLKTLPISNVMRLPLQYVYVILPICFGLMAFHIIYNIVDDTKVFLEARRNAGKCEAAAGENAKKAASEAVSGNSSQIAADAEKKVTSESCSEKAFEAAAEASENNPQDLAEKLKLAEKEAE